MLAALLVPVYWVMMSVAALKAMWQLVITPSFWEKTTHGLHADVGNSDAEKSYLTEIRCSWPGSRLLRLASVATAPPRQQWDARLLPSTT